MSDDVHTVKEDDDPLEGTSPKEPPRLSADEIRALARDVVTNKTFITNSEDGVRYAFGMVLMFGGLSTYDSTKIGGLYEDYDKQGPRSVNGFPGFFSMKVLHIDDLEPVCDAIEKMEEALS